MSIEVKVYANCDDVTIVWRSDQRIAGCRGFALYRQREGVGGQCTETILDTWVGFQGDPQAQSGQRRPSTEWPIQRFIWSDYFADGLRVRYRVVPMLGTRHALRPAPARQCSPWSEWVRVATGSTRGFRAYFNRGIVASQWVSRELAALGDSPAKSLSLSIRVPGSPLRRQLGGHLRAGLLRLLAAANRAGETVYAALFDLNDPELIEAMKAFGKRFQLLLSSGRHTTRKPDVNAEVRRVLRRSRTVAVHDRMVKGSHLGHNKFLVFCDSAGRPLRVWTGSTNWSVSGLCTQVNNGLLINNRAVAAAFKAQWDRLRAAGPGYPRELLEQGSHPANVAGKSWRVTVWNTPMVGMVDLEQASRLIAGAKQGVLFLMFNPGRKGTLLNTILDLDPKRLFVHGVINQDPGGRGQPLLQFHDRGTTFDSEPEAVVPQAVKSTMNKWFQKEYRGPMVLIHSKVVVIDPFGEHPVVMTGSHNLGPKASSKNDDNLVIIEHAPGLAAEYAVNILGVFGHYKWRNNQALFQRAKEEGRALVGTGKWSGLQDSDTWQDRHFQGARQREVEFWFGERRPIRQGRAAARGLARLKVPVG